MRKRSEINKNRSFQKKDEDWKPRKTLEFDVEVPNDPVNEQMLLAAEFIDEEARARLVKYSPDVFYAEQHRIIHAGMIELHRQGLTFDPSTLIRLAPEANPRVIETLLSARPEAPPNLDFCIANLEWDRKRAQVATGPLASFLEAFQDPTAPPDRVRAFSREIADAFEGAVSSTPHLRNTQEVIRQAMEALRKRAKGIAHFPFGVDGLDYDDKKQRRLRPGAAPGNITIVTGMSGSAKTTLAAHMILGLARQRRKVLVGAWEVRAPATIELLAVLSLGWSRSAILDGKSNELVGDALTEKEMGQLERRMQKIGRFVTFVENPFERGKKQKKMTNADYIDILDDHIAASGCDVGMFDLFDRCLVDRHPNDEMNALFQMLDVTQRRQMHSILVHQQLMKGQEVRADHRPSLAGLKGSSGYIDVSSLIIAPHMPSLFKDVPNETLEVFGLKQRNAPPFGIEFDWDPDTAIFTGSRDIAHDASGDEDDPFKFSKGKKKHS